MISLLIILSFMTAFAFSWVANEFDLAANCLQIFAIYALCFIIDTTVGLVNLGRSIEGSGKAKKYKPLTFIGRVFGSYQELFNFRNNTETSESEEQLAEVRTPQPEQEESIDSFMQESLSELDRAFLPMVSAIIYKDQQNSSIKIAQKGFRGRRFEEQIKLLFADLFQTEESRWIGVQDTLQKGFPSDDFSATGIRFLVSTAFQRFSVKGIICLGFESERRPKAAISEKLQFFTTDLERELGTLRNFHDLKAKADKAEEKSEERSKFLTEVSHDIRSPLNNVRTILSILRDDLKEVADGEKLVDTALTNCDLADELVESLIDFAKYRAGKLLAVKKDFCISTLIDEIVKANAVNASSKALILSFNLPKDPVYCHGDRVQIKRIINNLISNAIKYTDSGRVSVSIGISPENLCLIRVADSGSGISEKNLKQLFTPFVRFDQNDKKGTGLGLALSKALAEANAGSLEVRSEIDLGTIFALSLPVAQNLQIPDTEQIVSRLVTFPGSSRRSLIDLRILVVDDDIDSAESLRRYLSGKGARCKSEFNVAQTLDALEVETFDVIICDCRMPNGGGKQIVMNASKLSSKPVIIMVSGNIQEATRLIELGASTAMQKPLDLQKLEEYLYDLFFAYKNKIAGI